MNEPLKQHPLGAIFPPASDEDYARLHESIKTNGFNTEHPIVLHEGQILDGFNREMVVRDLGIKANYFHFIAPDMAATPLDYVLQENLNRRHLTTAQRASIAAELMERSLDAETDKGSNEPDEKLTVKKAAEIMHVSKSSVKRARASRKADKEAGGVEPAKKSSDAKGEALRTATGIIEKTLGDGWVAKSKITAADARRLSGLIPEEMKRMEPYLREGWSLKLAQGYKSTSLTYSHNIRQLVDRAIEFGKFTLEIDDWVISVAKKEK